MDHEGEGLRLPRRSSSSEHQASLYCAVAVGKEAAKEWKANLQWVLATFLGFSSRRRSLVLAHLHRPPSRINMMGAWVPVSQLAEEEVTAYRRLEEEKINKVLDDLLAMCASQKVNASKIIVACDDTARGLIQLVHDHGVAELVMGAASDRGYTRKMRTPRSKKALMVQKKANPSCKIWFVCKGNLICTREPGEGLNRAGSSTTSTSPRSSASDNSRSKSSGRVHSEPFSIQESVDQAASSAEHAPSREDDAMDSSIVIEDFNHEATLVFGSSTASGIIEAEGDSAILQSLQEIEEDLPTTSQGGSGGGEMKMDDELHEKLKDALREAKNLRHEAYEETRRRRKAERDLADASRMAMEAERSWQREARHRKEVEERVARALAAVQRDTRELDGVLDQARGVDARCGELELQVATSERAMAELQARLSESRGLLDELRRRRGREDAPAPGECGSVEMDDDDDDGGVSFLRVSYSELEEATDRFDESAMIGFGVDGGGVGRGTVYRGSLRGVPVAVKVIGAGVAVDEARFTREVEAMSSASARHPGMVAVVGACPEARAVAYELVAGGSLEEQLGALPWQARCDVAYRTCSALAFLHSTRPATVHGDVRPANILLVNEQGSSSKLGGLGTRRLVTAAAMAACTSAAALAYVEPEYLAATASEAGEVSPSPSPRCDVYALGVVLLRLVSGRAAAAAKKAAREAAGGSRAWEEVVDARAGWPTEVGREVALVALECCDVGRRQGDPRKLLEAARSVLEMATTMRARQPVPEPEPPSYLVCPIAREVMREPEIAGDGFTYEAEAMREWLDDGHDTSPMTNLKLPSRDLLPNHALRAAIQRWRHGHGLQ